MSLQAREDFAKAKFDQPSSVHFCGIFTQTEEEENQEAAARPNPTIKWHQAAGRNLDDVPPFCAVYEVPRVRKMRNGAVAVEDVELDG